MLPKALNFSTRELRPEWGEADLSILHRNQRPAPLLPLSCFGTWAAWIAESAEGKAAPADYVALAVLVAGRH
jgi:hypothetical protein